MRRHELTDEQWKRLEPLLPPVKPRVGRPNLDHRRILNAIRWRLRTGAPWRDLPERYGSWKTVYSRFRRWQQAGVWDRILAALQAEEDAQGNLDWTIHVVDGSVVRAHHHAAGAQRGKTTRWVAVVAVSPRRSTSERRGGASRSRSA
jgi:transposase